MVHIQKVISENKDKVPVFYRSNRPKLVTTMSVTNSFICAEPLKTNMSPEKGLF